MARDGSTNQGKDTKITNPYSDQLASLAAEFPKSEVRQRAGRGGLKLDYIGIDTTINRLNEVLGSEWSAIATNVSLSVAEDGRYLGIVALELQALDSSRMGVGASVGPDPDDVIKTAQAEALKKAANQYGVALYLWDGVKRQEIDEYRKLLTSPKTSSVQKALVAKFGLEEAKQLSGGLSLDDQLALLN